MSLRKELLTPIRSVKYQGNLIRYSVEMDQDLCDWVAIRAFESKEKRAVYGPIRVKIETFIDGGGL
jgi:hypothetical protein